MAKDKNNQVAVWVNKQRETERHPHLRGEIVIEGETFWISLWLQTDSGRDQPNPDLDRNCNAMLKKLSDVRGKSPVLSGSVQPKQERASATDRAHSRPAPANDYEDDIPF